MISRLKIRSFKLLLILISFFATTSVNAARIYFNDIFKGTGSSYAEQTNSISSIQAITGTGFTFTSTDPADVTFRLTGNNVAGTLSYINASGVKQSIVGQVSRQDKNGNTTVGLYFYTTTNEAYLLVIPGVTSYTSNTNVSTSSDPILAVMNDVLTAQNSQPKILVNDVTVSNADSYAVFTVSLSSAANANISFTPTLTAVTATLNTDYSSPMQYYNGSSWVNISSTVTIAQGTTSIQIRVPILNGGGISNRTFNLNTGAITGGNILNSDGAYGVGTITPTPSITVSNNLIIFSTCTGCTVNPQSFTVSGSNLTANITLTAPTNVVLSATSTGTYSSTLTLTQSSGTITTTSVFVKLTSNSSSISSGVITASSTNATSMTVSITTNTDNALNFDGSNDYISLSSNIPYTNNAITIDAWIKTTSPDLTSVDDIISWGNTTYGSTSTTKVNVVEFRVYRGKLSFVLNDNNLFFEITSNDYVNTGKWVHVAVVKSGTNITLYINGQVANATIVGNATSAPLPNITNIGALAYNGGSGYNVTAGSYFPGDIDQIRVWNTAKDITDISTNRFVVMSGNEPGLVASYDFNQGIANGSNGTLTILNNVNSNTYSGTLNNFALTGTSSNYIVGFIPSITATGSATSVAVGNTLQLTNGLTGGTWSSSNASFATVSSSGLVTGVASGSVTITYAICDKTVSYALTVTQPTITTTGTLKTFTSCSGCTLNPQNFSVSGSNLGANITLTAPTGVVLSTTYSGTYTSSLTLTQSGGSITTTSVYVKLSNNSTSISSGVISLTSTGASSKTLTVTTNADNALSFEGVDDYALLPSSVVNGLTNFTFETWVYPSSNSAFQRMFDFGINTSNYMLFTLNSGTPFFAIQGSSYPTLSATSSIPLNEWSHLAVVLNATAQTATIYINGLAAGSGNMPLNPSSLGTITTAYLGRGFYADPYFKGKMDEIRIWNTARSASEIANNYLNELIGNETGLQAYYNMNQGMANASNSGLTTLEDRTSAARTGTLYTFALSGTSSNYVDGFIPSITATGSATTLAGGATLTLSNNLSGGTWSTTNSAIATVNSSGIVTGVAAGSVTITYSICGKTTNYSLRVTVPTITTTGTLPVIASCSGCSVNPPSFTLSGSDLSNNITLTALSGVVISTTSTGTYSTSITLTQSSGSVTNTSIFVKLLNNAITSNSGVINITSTGASSKTITVTVNTDNALNFDGSDAINIGQPLSSGNSFTMEAWINYKGSLTENNIISSTNNVFWIYQDKLYGGFAPNYYIVGSPDELEKNKWYHVALTLDDPANLMKLYIDGNLVASTTTSLSFTGGQNSYIGSHFVGGPVSFFNGNIDEVRIWNLVRSDAEIAGSMNSELSGNESGLVSYYNFNQGVINGTNTSIATLTDVKGRINGSLSLFNRTGTTSNFVPGFIPQITGTATSNVGASSTLSNSLTGGTWSSTNTGVATVNSSTGVVTGVAAGSTTITYTICDKTVSTSFAVTVPTITASGTLTPFTTCSSSNSAAQSFTVSAQYLTANLVLTAPTGYEIATSSGGTYSSTISISPSSGSVSARLIFVRTTTSIVNGQSGNISITSTGATTRNVATDNAVVTQNKTASVSISSNATNNTICSGTSITFTATPTNGGTTPTYQWKSNGNIIAGATSSTYTTSALSSNVTITVEMGSSIASCISGSPATSNAINVVVNTVPNNPGAISGATTICMNSNQVYSIAAVTGATSYTWAVTGSLSATSTSTSNIINVTAANAAGSGTLTVYANNACGSSVSSATLTVNVNNTPAPTASFTSSVIGSICIGSPSVTFTSTSTPNATTNAAINSFSWTFGDGNTANTANASNTYATNGSFDAILTIQDANACTSSVSSRIIVDPLSVPGTATAAQSTICYASNTSITLTGNTGTVQWMSAPSGTNNFSNIIGATSNILNTGTLTSSTDYIAAVTSGSCVVATTSRLSVTVSPTPSATLSNVTGLFNNSTSFDLTYSNAVGDPNEYSISTSPNAMPNFVAISNYGLLGSPIIVNIPASASGVYNFNLVLANNTLGCSSANIPFTVTIAIQPPVGLSYNTPNVYTVGTTIAALTPTSTGGAISSYAISPSLPAGLTFNTSTGVISGTPSAVSSQTSYTVTGTNASGTITATVVITVNIAAPAGLSYTTPNVYNVGTAITALNPTSTGGAISSYAISPSLPAGLTFNTSTGVISGTPSAVSSQTSYTVTGTNASGTISATLVITVNAVIPAPVVQTQTEYCQQAQVSEYKYAKVVFSGLKNFSAANSIQVAEWKWYYGSTEISRTGVTVTNPGGSSPGGEDITKIYDGNTSTKWLDFNIKSGDNTSSIIFTFPGNGARITDYSWVTANDSEERDPRTWTVYMSNDNVNWTQVHSVASYPAPTGRFVSSYKWSYTSASTTVTLSATPLAGNTLRWYTTATGGTATTTAPTLNTNNVGPVTYYVSQIDPSSNESPRATLTVNVNALPAAPTVITPVNYALGATASALTATPTSGHTLKWYTVSTGGTATSTAFIPSTSSVGTQNYYVSQTNSTTSCESPRSLIAVVTAIAAPAGLSYTTPNVYTVGTAIAALNPTSTGGAISSYSISPNLPAGLSLNTTTGIISGTPTVASSQTSYTVTGTNTSGTITATVVITVNVEAPNSLSYTTPNVYTVGTAIAALNPTSTGGAISAYSISPNLPAGLSLNTTTGIISGTPTVASSQTSYTVTGTNTSGTITATVVITVNVEAPNSLSYTTPNIFTVGTAITALNPTSTGGAISSYSISPSLPAGLSLNTTTGIITGNPTAASSITSYIITGSNASGSVTATIEITVINNLVPPPTPPAKSIKYVYGNIPPNTPYPFTSDVRNLPSGTIPVYRIVGSTSFTTTPPSMPTAIGRYIFQISSYDTTTRLYSNSYVNDTIVIAPPAPIAIDSTYVIGVLSNPANVSVQVSGLTGATFNYYYLGALQSGTPVLGTVVGTKKYAVSQTVNSVEGDTSQFNVTLLDPNSIIHLQKIVEPGILQANSTYNYPFTLVVSNLTNTPFTKVVVTDNLQNSVPITSEFSVTNNKANGGLVANSMFNGSSDINVTLPSSTLAPLAKDTSKFTMNLVPKGYNGTLSNIAYVKADTKWGTIVMQSSSETKQNEVAKKPTTYVVKDLAISIPEGFSPNRDGINDKFVIIRPYNVIIDLEIFNRWGNIVYRKVNYNNDWDGQGTDNFAGQDLVDGGYYYTIKAIEGNGKVQILKGYIIIQR